MDRRQALKAVGLAAGAPLLTGLSHEKLLQVASAARASVAPALTVLTAAQAATVTELAEIILPRTDTPGATDAGVTAFIDTLLDGWMSGSERDALVEGLAGVDRQARAAHGNAFVRCTPAQRLDLVAAFDDEVAGLLAADRAAPADEYLEHPDGRPAPQAPGHFFYQFKRLVLLGYFTSEPGMVETLRYNPFPGQWDPCRVLEESR